MEREKFIPVLRYAMQKKLAGLQAKLDDRARRLLDTPFRQAA